MNVLCVWFKCTYCLSNIITKLTRMLLRFMLCFDMRFQSSYLIVTLVARIVDSSAVSDLFVISNVLLLWRLTITFIIFDPSAFLKCSNMWLLQNHIHPVHIYILVLHVYIWYAYLSKMILMLWCHRSCILSCTYFFVHQMCVDLFCQRTMTFCFKVKKLTAVLLYNILMLTIPMGSQVWFWSSPSRPQKCKHVPSHWSGARRWNLN